MLTLNVEGGLWNLDWCVDASFVVHPDFKSHAGANQVFSSGRQGSAQSVSAKQRLNMSSSTASGLVGVDQASPLMLWTPPFIEAQGHPIKNNEVFQHNKSAILLEENG